MTDISKEAVERFEKDNVTADELRSMVHYNPETGIFTRRVSTSSTAQAGDVAGCLTTSGYIQFRINSVLHMAHRLAWLYVYGEWPKLTVDHIDRDPTNNRISNLRLASHIQNCWNRRPGKPSSSGFRGVVVAKCKRKWRAQICANYKKKHLGTFTTPEDAARAYDAAAIEAHGEFATLNFPIEALKEQTND